MPVAGVLRAGSWVLDAGGWVLGLGLLGWVLRVCVVGLGLGVGCVIGLVLGSVLVPVHGPVFWYRARSCT